jgi:hypothetical protein
MKAIGTNIALQAALVLTFLGPAMPLHAQQQGVVGSTLFVCNKGTVPVEVVAAIRSWDVLRGVGKYYWAITSATAAPQECRKVENDEGDPSYIAFGFADSKGEWGSGRIAQVPDLGTFDRSLFSPPEKVLIGATKAMCARKDANHYAMDDDFSTDCATLKLTGGTGNRDVGTGPFFSLASALYFHPAAHVCSEYEVRSTDTCKWTYYYLDIFPSATDRELHAMRGTESGASTTTTIPESGGSNAARQAIAKALADGGQRAAKAKADAAAAQERNPFFAACNAFMGDPKTSRFAPSDPDGYCKCLSDRYQGVMTRAEEVFYGENFLGKFWRGIAQPTSTDPAWPRLNPVAVSCMQ